MRLSNLREAPWLQAILLINQEKTKKGFKTIQPEISKMSEIFGDEFDLGLQSSLFEEIDFKEIKNVLNSKNAKIQYFIQELPQLLERADFSSLFSEIFFSTQSANTAQEIFEGWNKLSKLSYENQWQIIISLIYSGNEKYTADAISLWNAKLEEIFKEGKLDQLSQDTVQSSLWIIGAWTDPLGSEKCERGEYLIQLENLALNYDLSDEMKQIGDIENILEAGNEDTIPLEKVFFEIGPYMINNSITFSEADTEMLNTDMDEKRLAEFIMFIMKHQTWAEDKENKHWNKIFLQSISHKSADSIDDESMDKKTIGWNIDNFYKMFKKSIDKMDANSVINAFDDQKFSIKDKKTFDFFISTLQKWKIWTSDEQFFSFIFTKWNHELNHIEFLSFLLHHQQNETMSFKAYSGKKFRKNVEIANSASLASLAKNAYLIDAWSCYDWVEVLLKLSKGNYYIKVKELFEWPVQNIPEIILLILVGLKPDEDEFLYDDIINEVLPLFIINHNNSLPLLEEVWKMNKEIIISTICKMYRNNPDLLHLSRIWDIVQKWKDSLMLFINCNDYLFSVSLAILAVKRDYLHIDQWIKDRIKLSGDVFIEAVLNYMNTNLITNFKGINTSKESVLEKAQLTLESLAIILENLITACSNPRVSVRIKNEIKECYKSIFDIFEELQVQPFNSEEIESSANDIFKSMFNEEITWQDVVDKWLHYQKSSNPKESELFACMIHCILDEYRFLLQYPEKQLSLSAKLFGEMINKKLVDGVIETVAWKYILEGLKKGTGALFQFSTIAWNQFVDKIHLWPTYLESWVNTKQLENSPRLYEKILKAFNESGNTREDKQNWLGQALANWTNWSCDENNKQGNENSRYRNDKASGTLEQKADKIKTKLTRPTNSINVNSVFQKLYNDSIDSQLQPPSQDIVDKMKLIFNSMSKGNVNEKSKELKALLSDQTTILWFSNFFLWNRIIVENNNHLIYSEWITLVNNKELNKKLTKDTISLIQKVLSKENIDKSAQKNALKNLGSWLGLMTLAKNKPILVKDLDLKEIIFDAYQKGNLNIILNFISRILEHSWKTKVFHPQNPWIIAMLSLFVEISWKPYLKQNWKLEIENWFKKLEIDMSSYPASNWLDNWTVCEGSSDFKKERNSLTDSLWEEINMLGFYRSINSWDTYIQGIINVMNQSPNSVSFSKTEIVTILTNVWKNSWAEIIAPVFTRAVNISLITTKEILIKDFMFDSDEQKFKRSANYWVKSLAGSLAMVSSKEPLRLAVNKQLKEYFLSKKIDGDTVDQILNLQNGDLLEIGCNYIHFNVIKKAMDKITNDPAITEEINKRKWNQSSDAQREELLTKMKILPEELKPTICGWSEDVLKVYENFANVYEETINYEESMKKEYCSKIEQLIQETIKFAVNLNSANSTSLIKLTKSFEVCMVNIQNVSKEAKEPFYTECDFSMIEKMILESKIQNEQWWNEFAFISLKYLIKAVNIKNWLLINVYSQLIKGWIKWNSDISKEITSVIFGYDIFLKFKYQLHYCFLSKNIFNIDEYSKKLWDLLENDTTKEPTRLLLQMLNEKGAFKNKQLKNIPSFMYDSKSKNYFSLFANKFKIGSVLTDGKATVIDFKVCHIKDDDMFRKFSDMCLSVFNQILSWMFKFKEVKSETFKEKMNDFFDSDLGNDDRMNLFIMIITDLCTKENNPKQYPLRNLYPENVAKCIHCILYAASNKVNKLSMFANLWNGIFKTLHQDYIKTNYNFNQRPYYIIWFNVLAMFDKYKNNEKVFDSEYKKINFLVVFNDFFRNLSPVYYPGFAMAWLDIVSSRQYVNAFLENDKWWTDKENTQKFEKYLLMIINILSYLKTISIELISLYSAKVLLDTVYKYIFLLCNSYPEFISSYYYILLISLPPGSSFIQLKNILLSSCPKTITQSEPWNEEIKNINSKPSSSILFDIEATVIRYGYKTWVDSFLTKRDPNIAIEIANKLNNENKGNDTMFYMIEAIIIYWAQIVIKYIMESKVSQIEVYIFFISILLNLDRDNRDHLINSIINELRFPSLQTYYFSDLFIHVFSEIKNEEIEDHWLTNLIERLLYKPHPWGLEVTFIQLIKSNKYVQMVKNDSTKKTVEEWNYELWSNCKVKTLQNYLMN